MCDKEQFAELLKFIQGCNDKQTEDLKTHIDNEIAEIKKIVNEEREKRNQLEAKYQELKQKYTVLEKSLRKNNIIIFGVENNTENTLLDFTLATLNEHLNLDLNKRDINNIFTIGKQTHKKPIIVKFVSFTTKIEVLHATSKLKGTNISIAEELSLEERKRNKILRQHLLEARSKGLTAYIKNNILHVNGEEYKAEQLADNEKDSDKEDNETTQSSTKNQTSEDKTKKKENQSNTQKIDLNTDPSTSTNKKRNNAVTEETKDNNYPESDPKKRKVAPTSAITAITSSQRSSPRFNEKEGKPNPTDFMKKLPKI